MLEIDPRVSLSKVGVKKYLAWSGILAIFGVSLGYFWPPKPTQLFAKRGDFGDFLETFQQQSNTTRFDTVQI